MRRQRALNGACDHETCTGACPRTIRTQVRIELLQAGWTSEAAANAELAASELASNAQDHASGPYTASMRYSASACEIAISDRGPSGKGWEGVDRGRGRVILTAISAELGVRHGGGLVTHWARITNQ